MATGGADGLKTGHRGGGLRPHRVGRSATAGGWSWCSRDSNVRRPARESERLLEYGFRQFRNYQLFARGQAVDQADVWLGATGTVPLVIQEDVWVSLTPEARRQLEVKVVYDGPIPAPVADGSPVAELAITAPGLEPLRFPLVAGTMVPANVFNRMTSARLSDLGILVNQRPASPLRQRHPGMTRPGRLITFEGGEGAGKSTQIEHWPRRCAPPRSTCSRPGSRAGRRAPS